MSRLARVLFLLLSVAFLAPPPAARAGELRAHPRTSSVGVFPLPASMTQMVDFWKDIFARYSAAEVVFHDEQDLSLIYERMKLGELWMGSREQSRRIRHRRERIESVLKTLAAGHRPDPADERLAGRLRKVLVGKSRREIRQAAEQVRAQPGLKERFIEGYERSGRYLKRFREIFRRYGVPEDLTLLPHVESGFRNAVYSKARALGMWQFTRPTARLFMRVDSTVDARRDPFLAAEAAARLLRQNYDELGAWPLAITAYNHGVSGMRRAVAHVGSRNIARIIKGYDGRSFGFASRNFYAEFLAAVYVHKHAERYFGKLRTDPPLRFESFPLPASARVYDLSRSTGVKLDDLRDLNPALRSRVFRGGRRVPRGYPLRLPPGKVELARRVFSGGRLVALARPDGEWVNVRPGDTLGRIAARHRVSVDDLMAANALKGTLIHPGDRLLLPARGGAKKRLEVASASAPPTITPGAVRPPAPPAPAAAKAPAAVTVSRKIEAAELKTAPARDSSPAPRPVVKLIPLDAARRKALAVRPLKGGRTGLVRVQENETISHFAGWLDVPDRRIRRMNRLGRGRTVRVGLQLRIPLERVSKESFLEKRISYHVELRKEFARKYTVAGAVRHKLEPRENVWVLVTRVYRLPYWLVQKMNPGRDLRRIQAGEEVLFPVVKRR